MDKTRTEIDSTTGARKIIPLEVPEDVSDLPAGVTVSQIIIENEIIYGIAADLIYTWNKVNRVWKRN